ncbi:DUF924 family protein [Pseudoruegeria sp. SK021]|uniref:DUF924 family protein n=1 Tax=Pseudoruegeria sp. SK021 TaxID=1933035 RepID=UPI000A231BAE|nr:DUF924 family protein [Pseudoruegeria sp. SK021]OSP56229.1 hypothetical protein BV911_02750 [Pseudoruegeria sp. SK021]
MPDPNDLLTFWIDEIGPEGWYRADDAVDAIIRERFEPLWTSVHGGVPTGWTPTPDSVLALLILLDQFPRNMFRGSAKSFATDPEARAKAKKAIARGWDLRIAEPARQFLYTPLMHSECLEDQERSVRLYKARMSNTEGLLIHARAHREVIRRFGRFPHRNIDLGRKSTAAEVAFLDDGGYRTVVDSLRKAA